MRYQRRRAQQKSTLSICGINVAVTRKAMKNIRLKVTPPHGTVNLSAPHSARDQELTQVIKARLNWIRQQQNIIQQQPQPPTLKPGNMVSLWGETLQLQLEHHTGHISVKTTGDQLVVRSSESRPEMIESVLEHFYRQQLRALLPELATKWQPIVGREASFWGIKKMKTRWGSCNTDRARIWLNLELVKHPPRCLDYVVVHELTHLIERNHSARFYQCVNRAMPDWETWHRYLNQR